MLGALKNYCQNSQSVNKSQKNMSVLNAEGRDEVNPQQILTLTERFPNVIKADAREQHHLELLYYVSTNLEGLVSCYRSLPVEF